MLRRCRRDGAGSFAVGLALLVVSALAARLVHGSVLAVLLGAAAISAAWTWWQRRKTQATE